MSFGFSVGDFVAGANLAYTLAKALSDSKGAAREYRDLVAALNVVHKVLLQVDDLRIANKIPTATTNALLFATNSTSAVIEIFLDEHEGYEKSLKQGGSGNAVKDIYRKGKWATQMPDKIRDLEAKLATMLAAMNCLLSLACYYNTSYDSKCVAVLDINQKTQSTAKLDDPGCSWNNLTVASAFYADFYTNAISCPGFETQLRPRLFFRPGQIFAMPITSNLSLYSSRRFRNVDFGHLPLKPVPELQALAKVERAQDQMKRLEQIQQLPLEQMTRYCEDVKAEKGKVRCLLCDYERYDYFSRDEWASYHFRTAHWEQYFGMIKDRSYVQEHLRNRAKHVVPWEKQNPPGKAPKLPFSSHEWITSDDVLKHCPIRSDKEVIKIVLTVSTVHHYLAGTVMVQRFVVVRQATDYCLCMGIHSYARLGCGGQPDQELFGVISSEKKPGPLQADETGIILLPVRMKPDHPSTALPSTARIHYGRLYEIAHDMPVEPIGLVHPGSMETLLVQFEVNAKKNQQRREEKKKQRDLEERKILEEQRHLEDTATSLNKEERIGDTEATIEDEKDENIGEGPQAADMQVVENVRRQIAGILGPEMSPIYHQPPGKGVGLVNFFSSES